MLVRKRKYKRLMAALGEKDSALHLAQQIIDERQSQLLAYAALSKLALSRMNSCREQLEKLNKRIESQ